MDENPFASPAEVETAQPPKFRSFRLTVAEGRAHQWMQVAISGIICALLAVMLAVSAITLVPIWSWRVTLFMYVLGTLSVGSLFKAFHHWNRALEVSDWLPLCIEPDGIQANCQINGKTSIIQWPWRDVAKIKLKSDRRVDIISHSGTVASCNLRRLSRTQYKQFRHAARQINQPPPDRDQ